jgi:hypothetical protein
MTGAAKMIADNWTLSTTFSAQTGTPFTMFDCYFGITVCPRAGFVTAPARNRTGNMTNLSPVLGANTFSYIHLPDYFDSNGIFDTANYTEQLNPDVNAYYGGDLLSPADWAAGSDVPVCAGIHGAGCHLNPTMDGRNLFRGPGSWNENLGIVKDFKFHDRYDVQVKGEFINMFNHANTALNLGGSNDVGSYTDVLAYKTGNRNTQLSVHIEF